MRRGRGRQGPRGPTPRQQVQLLRKEIMGHTVVPSRDPSMYVQRPWNLWTFQLTDITQADFDTVTITIQNIVDQIRSRCNINPVGPAQVGNQIQLRVISGYFWVTAASLVQPDVEAVFYELNPNDQNQSIRCTQRDVGTLNMPAKVGYVYPINDSKEVLGSNDGNTKVMSATAVDTASRVTARVNVLWKSSS